MSDVVRRARAAATIRAAFGLVPLFAPGPASRLLGFPPEEDSSTARLMGRLFGVRELALAAIVWLTPGERDRLLRVLALNAAVDAGDAAVFAGAVATRAGVDRAAGGMMLPALAGCAIWLDLMRRL